MIINAPLVGKLFPTSEGAINEYRLPWGFFTATQRTAAIWDETHRYVTNTKFVISGAFTVDAEAALAPSAGIVAADGEGVDVGKATAAIELRITNLEDLIHGCIDASRPEEPVDWYTANDPRCIRLPEPIVADQNRPIYALPQAIRIEDSQLPLYVRYTVELAEGILPEAVLVVNGVVLREARLSIEPPQPQIVRCNMLNGEGTGVQVRGYSRTQINIQGSLLYTDNVSLFNQGSRNFAAAMAGTQLKVESINWVVGGVERRTLLDKVMIAEPTISSRPTERGFMVSLAGVL